MIYFVERYENEKGVLIVKRTEIDSGIIEFVGFANMNINGQSVGQLNFVIKAFDIAQAFEMLDGCAKVAMDEQMKKFEAEARKQAILGAGKMPFRHKVG